MSRFETKYTATASGRFDVDMHGAVLRGRVVDARSGAPLLGARVMATSRTPGNGAAVTDSDGRFAIETLPDATYDLHVDRDEYAPASQSVVVANGSAPDVEVRMEQAQPTTFHVTDSVTGAPIDANVMIQDASGAPTRSTATRMETGTLRAWLKQGSYNAFVISRGYVYKSQSFTTPGDVNIVLVRGGALVIRARTAQLARLDLPGGTQRGLGPVHPGPNGPYDSLAPGSYMLTLTANEGKTTQSIAVVINAGQTTTVDVPWSPRRSTRPGSSSCAWCVTVSSTGCARGRGT